MSKYDKWLVPSTSPDLRRVCDPVLPGEDVSKTCDRMELVCKRGSRKGVGLAAPQIGVCKRIVFINCMVGGTIRGYFMLNPVILSESSETNIEVEGCLSYPGKSKAIARPDWITVQYMTPQRRVREIRAEAYHARVICHEVDHLNGICRVGDDSPAAMPYEREEQLIPA